MLFLDDSLFDYWWLLISSRWEAAQTTIQWDSQSNFTASLEFNNAILLIIRNIFRLHVNGDCTREPGAYFARVSVLDQGTMLTASLRSRPFEWKHSLAVFSWATRFRSGQTVVENFRSSPLSYVPPSFGTCARRTSEKVIERKAARVQILSQQSICVGRGRGGKDQSNES